MSDQFHAILVGNLARTVSAVRIKLVWRTLGSYLGVFFRATYAAVLFGVVLFAVTSGISIAHAADVDKQQPRSVVESDQMQTEGALFTKVHDGMFVRYGRHEPLTADSIADIANHGFIIGEAGVAIIDPGGSVDIAERSLIALRKITSLPVTHVIVSHVHPDHSLGLAHYAGDDLGNRPIILGHPKLASMLANNLDFFKQHYTSDGTTDKLLKLIESGQIQAVNGELTFDLGNRKITVTSFANAHSGSDISVYDNTTKTLWAGDLLFVDRLPAIDGSILGWLDALSRLDQYDITTVIPGHGRSGDYATLAQPQQDYLNLVVKGTREAIAKGTSLSDFISNNGISAHGSSVEWKLFDAQHAVNLSRSYAELEWE